MARSRTWITAAIGMAALSVTPLWAETPSVAQLLQRLTSDEHRTREQAVGQLASAGPGSVAALMSAALSRDPELSWRAEETLQIVCRTIDFSQENALRTQLAHHSRSMNKAEAALAQKLMRQWPALRHDYAAGQLEMLGAEIADVPPEQMMQTVPIGGGMPVPVPMMIPGGGGFGGFFGLMPMMVPRARMVEIETIKVAAEPAPVADAPVVEPEDAKVEEEADEGADIEAVEERRADEIEDKPEDKPADKPAEKPLFGGIFKALGRAAKGEPPVEIDPVAGEIEILDEPEIVEDAGPAMMDIDVGFIGGGDVAWIAPGVAALPTVENELQPGTMRIGKAWRGGDSGLEYVKGLQQIHTVILRDAPVTDAALAKLASLPSLTVLRIDSTRFSSSAILKFRKLKPSVQVTAVGPAVLGVSGSDHPQGLLIQAVTPETGARRAGLDEQDIVTKVGGQPVRGINDVTLALFDKQVGQKVKIDYLRGGKAHSVDVVLTSREESHPDIPATAADQQPLQQFESFDSSFPLRGRAIFGFDR